MASYCRSTELLVLIQLAAITVGLFLPAYAKLVSRLEARGETPTLWQHVGLLGVAAVVAIVGLVVFVAALAVIVVVVDRVVRRVASR